MNGRRRIGAALVLLACAGIAAWWAFGSAAGAGIGVHPVPSPNLATATLGGPGAALQLSAADPLGNLVSGPRPLSLDRALGPIAWGAAGPYRDGHVLVGFRRAVSPVLRQSLELDAGAIRAHPLGRVVLLTVPLRHVPAVIGRLRRDPAVRFAEPDYVLQANGVPSDPQFGLQWGLWNNGQVVNGIAGTPNADEGAMPAWNATTGSSSIVIAETDTGVDYTHPDLAANIWSNPGGIGGCAAGTHGFDVLAGENPCDPNDTDTAYGGHGTHVAGIMGAVGNNGAGVTGVNWTTSIMPVKWLDSNSSGLTSDLIGALQTVIAARQAGVNIRVVNDSISFVGTAYSQALADEIDQLGANDIMFVTPAGNTSQDDDTTPRYPCSYDRPNEICVAATGQNDQLPSWASYGANTVDLAAPGDNIYSTLENNGYGYISGSSMSAAEVSGAAALILSVGYQSATAVKADILNNVDRLPSLSGLVRSGGRLDICKALPGCTVPPPTYTLGKTQVGMYSSAAGADYKRANVYTLGTNAVVSKLSVYLQPTGTNGTQPDEGLIYADSNGSPGSLVAVTNPLTFSSSDAPGWYDLPFPTAVQLTPGTYWLGFISGSTSGVTGLRYDWVSGSRAYNANSYASGPSDPFGSAWGDGEQMSLYATYTIPTVTSPPTNTAVPTISGSPRAGQTLSAGNGSWTGLPSGYRYQWRRCDATGTNCATLSGATSQTYAVTQSDAGSTLEVAVTASNSAGPTTALSAPTAPVQAMQTSATFGNTNVGAYFDVAGADYKRANEYTLSTTATVSKLSIYLQPTWVSGTQPNEGVIYADSNGSPGSLLAVTEPLTYSSSDAAGWYDLPFAKPPQLSPGNYWIGFISGQSSWVTGLRYDYGSSGRAYNANSYASGPSDPFGASSTDGEQMSLYATYSIAPPAPPAANNPPVISGTARVGQTLSTSNGSWSGSPSSFGYQWQRCDTSGSNCTAITAASSPTYTVTNADAGSTLAVAVTAFNAGGSAIASSTPTATVPQAPPSSTGLPQISGMAQDGQTLTASSGSWGGSPGSYGYQWQRCDANGNNCTAIPGAGGSTYAAGGGDVGSTLEVAVTASNTAGSTTVVSTPTATVLPAAPANIAPPTISGAAQVGQTLTTSDGGWNGSPTAYAYQWQRCDASGNHCAAISGATAQSYVVDAADVGSTLEAAVAASSSSGAATASSAPSATVPEVPPNNTAAPAISGSAISGQTLTASNGTWTGTSPSYSYQWRSCDASANNCAPMSRATSRTYSVTTNDVGTTLEVAVTGSNAAGSASATSSPTQTVQAAPPTTFGTTTVGPNSDAAASDHKRVNAYALSGNGTVTKLSVYLQPTSPSGTQTLEGVIYADSGGAPSSLIAVSNVVTFASTEAAGWYDLTFATPVHLTPGNYWLGFISGATYGVAGFSWTSVAGSRDINANVFTSGPSDPFGPFSTDDEEISLYATYTPG